MKHRVKTYAAAAALAVLLVSPSFAQVEDPKDIKYPPLPEFKVARPEVYQLENGMKVFLMEDHELPLITATARIRTGAYYEPQDKVGLADLMGTVQRTGGTAKMSGDDIDDFLAQRAASVETGMGGTAGFASMNCLKDDFDDVFQVFNDVLRTPAFDEEKLKIAKVQATAGIARRNDNVQGVTGREFRRLIYGPDSPLASLEEYATIAAVSRDDLAAWHKRFYHPNNVMLGVVGDFDSNSMKKKIEAMFGGWPKGPGFDLPEIPYRKKPQPGVYFIEKKDVTQANIAIGHLGIEAKNPDVFAVEVMNEVLGGGFAGRLFSNVRSNKGLAYSVYGALGSAFTYDGIFRVGLQTKSERMTEAVEALKVEIVGMIENPPTDEEMARAKEQILNSFIFNYDSKAEILSQQMVYAYYGLPADYLEKYRDNIEAVKRDDVVRVAKKYLHSDRLTLLVVGNPEDFDKPVETLGEVTTIDITIPPPPDTTPKVEKTAAALETGATVLARMARHLAGGDPSEMKAIRAGGTLTVAMGGQSMTLSEESVVVFPDRVRQVLQTPMGDQVMVFDGEEGFVIAGGQTQPLPGAAIERVKADTNRDLGFLVHFYDDPEMEAVEAGRADVDGVPCTMLEVTFRGAECRLWIDAAGKVLKQVYQGNHPMTQAPGTIEKRFEDYREIDGAWVPHKQVVSFEGEEITTYTLTTYEVNPEVDPSLFEKPE